MLDVIVVGLGAMGSAALYHLASRGARVVGVDTYEPPHALGSTHGRSRIIREAYYEHPSYVPLVRRAYENWAALERTSGLTLFQRTGGLMLGAEDSGLVRGALASATHHAIPVEPLTAREVVRRFPAYVPEPQMVGVFESNAGVLFPEACVRAHLAAAQAAGAEVRVGTKVIRLWRERDSVSVLLDDGRIEARRVIVAAGPWAPKLLAMVGVEVPLVVERQTLHWFDQLGTPEIFQPERCPVALIEHARDRIFYVMPNLGDGVKAAVHYEGVFVSPDDVERVVSEGDRAPVQALVQRFVPAAGQHIGESAVCLYTNTPDLDFIIDRPATAPEIVVVSACSGHGFKFASAIGEVAAQLALGDSPTLDVAHFGVRRFDAPIVS